MVRRHVHTYQPTHIVTLTLPDATGQHSVMQIWYCACGSEMDLASDVGHSDRLLPYAEAMGQYEAEERRKRTRTILK